MNKDVFLLKDVNKTNLHSNFIELKNYQAQRERNRKKKTKKIE